MKGRGWTAAVNKNVDGCGLPGSSPSPHHCPHFPTSQAFDGFPPRDRVSVALRPRDGRFKRTPRPSCACWWPASFGRPRWTRCRWNCRRTRCRPCRSDGAPRPPPWRPSWRRWAPAAAAVWSPRRWASGCLAKTAAAGSWIPWTGRSGWPTATSAV